MLVYEEDVFGIEPLAETEDIRLPSFPSPTIDEEALAEITLEEFPDPEKRLFAAGGRDDMLPDRTFPVAAASTADAVTGLF